MNISEFVRRFVDEYGLVVRRLGDDDPTTEHLTMVQWIAFTNLREAGVPFRMAQPIPDSAQGD